MGNDHFNFLEKKILECLIPVTCFKALSFFTSGSLNKKIKSEFEETDFDENELVELVQSAERPAFNTDTDEKQMMLAYLRSL